MKDVGRAAVCWFLLLSLLGALQRVDADLRHIGGSSRDQWIECSRKVFRKLVVYDPDLPQNPPPPEACGKLSRKALEKTLKAQGIAVLEEKEVVMLRSPLLLAPCGPSISEGSCARWRHFRITISTKNASGGFTERALSKSELTRLQEAVLGRARLVPAFQADGEPLNVKAATFPLQLEVYVRRLKNDAPASVVIVIKAGDNVAAGRLVYGEERAGGGFDLLWDSPLFVARYLDVTFDDVDGDGFQELLLKAAFPAGVRDTVALTIFDRSGRELTRQAYCMQPVGFDFWKYQDTCPIVGEAVDLRYTNAPPFDILVRRVFHTRRDEVFRLKGGGYAPLQPLP